VDQRPRRPFWSIRRREAAAGYAFAAPWIVGFLTLSLFPMLFSLWLSLHEWDGVAPFAERRYVGLGNYRKMVANPQPDMGQSPSPLMGEGRGGGGGRAPQSSSSRPSPTRGEGEPALVGERDVFLKSLWNTAYYAVFSVPLGLAMALGLAVLLSRPVRGLALWRTIFYLPSLVSGVATYVLWMWLFDPQFGLLNTLLRRFGIDGPAWLASETWAKPALIVMSLWSVGSGMLIFLAGLLQVPREQYEAAHLDGAGPWARFRYVTVPHLSPLIFFNLVLGLIGALHTFAQAYVMTGGGPANSTLFFALYIYEKAFDFHEMGYACALSWVMFAIALGLTLLLLRSSRLWVYAEGAADAR
jgi:multiple sugar transport system permease protein